MRYERETTKRDVLNMASGHSIKTFYKGVQRYHVNKASIILILFENKKINSTNKLLKLFIHNECSSVYRYSHFDPQQ